MHVQMCLFLHTMHGVGMGRECGMCVGGVFFLLVVSAFVV